MSSQNVIYINGRPELHEYFMTMAFVAASRSTCLHHKVGAILTKGKHIISTGYNGAPSGLPHCCDIGCPRENVNSGTNHDLCRAVHAEQNAIIQAAIHGTSTEGTTLYCTHQPCILCAKMIINAKIKRVFYRNSYPDTKALKILDQAGVLLIQQ